MPAVLLASLAPSHGLHLLAVAALSLQRVFIAFLASSLPRAIAAPAVFGPAVAMLAAALAVRTWGALTQGRAPAGVALEHP